MSAATSLPASRYLHAALVGGLAGMVPALIFFHGLMFFGPDGRGHDLPEEYAADMLVWGVFVTTVSTAILALPAALLLGVAMWLLERGSARFRALSWWLAVAVAAASPSALLLLAVMNTPEMPGFVWQPFAFFYGCVLLCGMTGWYVAHRRRRAR
jgi:hypothetical protein